MIWNSKVVSLSNYEKIFSGYSKDTLEVVRSALFDCTPIEPYIKRFVNDPYMLWQVKLSIDEGVDEEWFDICPNGRILSMIRELVSKGINVEYLKDILKGSSLSEEYYLYIIKWYRKGVYLGKYNFSILPENLLGVFDYGISLGFPMYIFNNGISFSHEYVSACLRILSNNRSVSDFLGGDWDLANISLLAKYSKSKYYDKLVEYVSNSITPSILEEIYECCKVGMPLKDVSVLDKDGIYVYNSFIIALSRDAYMKKLDYKSLLVPGINISEATAIMNEMELQSSKKLSGRLRKSNL